MTEGSGGVGVVAAAAPAAAGSDQPHANRIKVFLRIRPANQMETSWMGAGQCGNIMRDEQATPTPEKRVIVDKTNKIYDFDRVFRANSSQEQIFKEAALPTLKNVFSGYCGAILAYGQTGTGKTHTMQGYASELGDPRERGVIPRCAEYIFTRIAKHSDQIVFSVSMSFVQIYLNKLQDLFQPEAPEVTIDPDTERVELPGIVKENVGSPEEFMNLYRKGEKHRTTRAMPLNPTSSRGHAAVIVNIAMNPRNNDGSQPIKHGKLVLVDLAGYERFTTNKASTGIAAEEAKKINASLLALGNVVYALADVSDAEKKSGAAADQQLKQYHIPYRNAKLTRLLKDCLGGTSVTAIILTIGPCDRYNHETATTLYFGWRAMAVKVDARIKSVYDQKSFMETIKGKLKSAQERIRSMAGWWSRSNPKDYREYVSKHGEPEYASVLTDEEDRIIDTMIRSTRAASGGSAMHRTGSPWVDDLDNSAPPEVAYVKRTYGGEMERLNQRQLRELELLQMRHLQDIEEAKKAGCSEQTLAQLRKSHEEELDLMREQQLLLKRDLDQQRQKEEVSALLRSASKTAEGELYVALQNAAASSPAQGERARQNYDQELFRIKEIVDHLQTTCENKDEVLNRLFELVCYYERQLKYYKSRIASEPGVPSSATGLLAAQSQPPPIGILAQARASASTATTPRAGGAASSRPSAMPYPTPMGGSGGGYSTAQAFRSPPSNTKSISAGSGFLSQHFVDSPTSASARSRSSGPRISSAASASSSSSNAANVSTISTTSAAPATHSANVSTYATPSARATASTGVSPSAANVSTFRSPPTSPPPNPYAGLASNANATGYSGYTQRPLQTPNPSFYQPIRTPAAPTADGVAAPGGASSSGRTPYGTSSSSKRSKSATASIGRFVAEVFDFSSDKDKKKEHK